MLKLIFFDLDGTLTESKQVLTKEMAGLVCKLLEETKVAIISGGALPQFIKQVIEQLPASTSLENLYLLPTSGASLYEWRDNDWKKVYEERIPESDAKKIERAIEEGAKESGVVDMNVKTAGPRTEYRGGEITFSALGQNALFTDKKAWDPDRLKRRALQSAIERHLPRGYVARMGGATSIDINKDGVDKSYGVHQLCERLGISESTSLYVGDELIPHGNDEAVFKTQIQTRAVTTPADTAHFIISLLET